MDQRDIEPNNFLIDEIVELLQLCHNGGGPGDRVCKTCSRLAAETIHALYERNDIFWRPPSPAEKKLLDDAQKSPAERARDQDRERERERERSRGPSPSRTRARSPSPRRSPRRKPVTLPTSSKTGKPGTPGLQSTPERSRSPDPPSEARIHVPDDDR